MLTDSISLALGYQHSIILKPDGSVWSTAVVLNSHGPSSDVSKHFVRVLPKGAIAVDAGKYHNIALMQDGSVWSTAQNSAGKIWFTAQSATHHFGDRGSTSKGTFFFVQMIYGAKAVAMGDFHSMVLTKYGHVWSTGLNERAQLGDQLDDDSTLDKATFVRVISSGSRVVAMAAGDAHSVVVKKDGSVWATGRNYYGQLGDGSTDDKTDFVKAMSSGAAHVAAGSYHSLVVKRGGSVWATGRNEYGQLGDGTTTDSVDYTQVVPSGAKAVAAGSRHSMVLKQHGSVWATGYNIYGQLGDGSTINRRDFVQVIYNDADAIAAGGFHSMVLKKNGDIWAAGSNQYGQFGDGIAASEKTFVRIEPFANGAGHVTTYT